MLYKKGKSKTNKPSNSIGEISSNIVWDYVSIYTYCDTRGGGGVKI